MADVCTHTRTSLRGVASLLFGALVGIGGKCRKIKMGWQGVRGNFTQRDLQF
jgi:hypothetical protein